MARSRSTDHDHRHLRAAASYLPFVRTTWRSVVAPNQALFIGLLVAFEVVAGRATRP